MLHERVLNKLIPAYMIPSEKGIWHIEVMFMPCDYTMYVGICLTFLHVVHNKQQY